MVSHPVRKTLRGLDFAWSAAIEDSPIKDGAGQCEGSPAPREHWTPSSETTDEKLTATSEWGLFDQLVLAPSLKYWIEKKTPAAWSALGYLVGAFLAWGLLGRSCPVGPFRPSTSTRSSTEFFRIIRSASNGIVMRGDQALTNFGSNALTVLEGPPWNSRKTLRAPVAIEPGTIDVTSSIRH